MPNRQYVHEVLVNLPRKIVVRWTYHPKMSKAVDGRPVANLWAVHEFRLSGLCFSIYSGIYYVVKLPLKISNIGDVGPTKFVKILLGWPS